MMHLSHTSNSIKQAGRALAIAVLALCSGNALAVAAAQSGFYLDSYGPADPQTTPGIDRAKAIFRKLKRTAGQQVSSTRLLIINSQGNPWAVALADGNIVLTSGALEIIYANQSPQNADARLAFVLGHELAHMANRDLWHHRVYASMAGNTPQHSLARVQKELRASVTDLADIRERELKADEVGFVYASLAGYSTGSLLPGAGGKSFLRDWVDQTHAWIDDEHHSPEERTAFLASRLRALQQEVALFQYGVRLAHFGRHEDALYFLEAFERQFPSRQVLSNLGYVHIQLARKAMSPGLAYRFWYPTLLETQSGLPELPRQWQNNLPQAVVDHLEQAVLLLEQASKQEAGDIVSRINLIVAHLYLGEVFKARAVVEEALQRWPDDTQLAILRALVLLDQEPQVDMWQHVTSQLEALLQAQENPPANLIYNVARLYAERGRHGQAGEYWQQLLGRLQHLPDTYRQIVCIETGHPAECKQANNSKNQHNEKLQAWLRRRFDIPVALGTHMDSRQARKAMSGWQQQEWHLGPLSARVFSSESGDALLALDHHAELSVIASDKLPSASALTLEHGEPSVALPLGSGTVWSYGPAWSAFLQNNRVVELWIARQ